MSKSRSKQSVKCLNIKNKKMSSILIRYSNREDEDEDEESQKSTNVCDEYNNTVLHKAVVGDNRHVLKHFLSYYNIDINVCNKFSQTPLIVAVKKCKLDMAKILIDHGADVNFYNSQHSSPPLHFALGHPAMCRLLIKHGANINATGFDGMSALHYAVIKQCLETVCMLLYFNVDANVLDKDKETPFHRSLYQGNVEIQRVLLDYVVDFNVKTVNDESILELALMNDSPFVFGIIERETNLDSSQIISILPTILSERPNNYEMIVLLWSKLKVAVDLKLIFDYLEKIYLERFIDVIIESDNFNLVVVDSITKYNNLSVIIDKFLTNNLKLEQLTKFVCRLLSEGYQLASNDINKVYSRFGYCELFRLFLYTSSDDYCWESWMIVPRFIFDFRSDVNEILSEEILIDREAMEHAFQYAVNPVFINAYIDKYGEVSAKVLNLPKVPSLLELARNKARKHIADVFECQTSCQFYTCINCLDIPDDYKEILTFERKLYEL